MSSIVATDIDVIQRVAVPAPGGMPSTAELADLVGDARIGLIGEGSHGTREFYDARARITQSLIAERGVNRHASSPLARIVVWAHNSHVGDARATERSAEGQLTLGQLARDDEATRVLDEPRPTRAIGVIYAPRRWNRWSRVAIGRPVNCRNLIHRACRNMSTVVGWKCPRNRKRLR